MSDKEKEKDPDKEKEGELTYRLWRIPPQPLIKTSYPKQ